MLDFINWQFQKLAIYILSRSYNFIAFTDNNGAVTGITFTTDRSYLDHCIEYKDTTYYKDTSII